ncbi:MAG TPA: hypothetical protein PKD83_11755 [Ignavibacteria bacterium]|nr:hypothetical protein [Ignavibacteria bacterium]
MIIKSFFIVSVYIFLFTIICNDSFSQGCSDAGFCTVHGLKPDEADTIKYQNNQINIGTSFGFGDYSISVTNFYASYYRQITEKLGFDLKSTAVIQNGNGINSTGFSDIFFTADYNLNDKTNFILGTKIPLSNADKSQNSLPLPMDYQSSLGTLDIIVGASTIIENVELSIALQQPLTQNDNKFFANEYPSTSILSTFQSTNDFIRKGDILLRASYPFSLGRKISASAGILPIFHLGNDEYTDTSDVKVEIEGSSGLTLNITLYVDYFLNQNSILQLNAGAPVITRDSKPEGLGRSFVAALNYIFLF